MAMRTRADFYHCETGINTPRLVPTSRLVSKITGIQVQRNKAIVGRNAFAHEAGIHQDGMLKDRSTYEIMKPEDVGIPRTVLVLGKHRGRAALRQRIQDLNYHLTDDQLNKVFDKFKLLADRKKDIYDARCKAGDPDTPKWAKAGFYARVVHEGLVVPGAPVTLESEMA